MLGWTAALFFHLFAGIRHLAWDVGIGFAKPGLNPVSWLVLAATAVATILVWAVTYARLEG
jgi:succinate dehydrogenase / fumarate reductase cytochrome b subunit